MTDRPITNVAASVRQRLLNRARAEGRAFQELATLCAMERFLFRLGRFGGRRGRAAGWAPRS